MSDLKSNNKLTKALTQIEALQQIVTRLEKVTEKINESVGEVSLLEILEDEIQQEVPYAEKEHLGITGANTSISWAFEDIVDVWRETYADQGEEGTEAMKDFAVQFHKLAQMFEEEAKIFEENP
jgi:hypothetical protein